MNEDIIITIEEAVPVVAQAETPEAVSVNTVMVPVWGSGSAGVMTLPAGAPISAGRGVKVVDGEAHYADAGEAIGISTHAAGAGANLEAVTSGRLKIVGWGLVEGATYYSLDGGVISPTAPASGKWQAVGVAIDSETLLVNFSITINL